MRSGKGLNDVLRICPKLDPMIFLEFILSWILVTGFVWVVWGQLQKVQAPRVGKNPWIYGLSRARTEFVQNGKYLTRMGYSRYKDSIYWIQTGDMERLVVSNRYLNELRKLPDAYLDSKQAVVERNLGWYNGVDIILKSTTHVDVCRTQLVQNLSESKLPARPPIC